MCLPDFQQFEQIREDSPITGYRIWRNLISDSTILSSEFRDFQWKRLEGPHEVLGADSGIYSWKYKHDNGHNYEPNNNSNYFYYQNRDYYRNYYIKGIIKQWGKTAIHKYGYRSEFARINSIFSIKEFDWIEPNLFGNWVRVFNKRIALIAEYYDTNVIPWTEKD